MITLALALKLAGAAFIAGGAWWRLSALERRLAADLHELRADVRAVHARIDSELGSRVIPLRARES